MTCQHGLYHAYLKRQWQLKMFCSNTRGQHRRGEIHAYGSAEICGKLVVPHQAIKESPLDKLCCVWTSMTCMYPVVNKKQQRTSCWSPGRRLPTVKYSKETYNFITPRILDKLRRKEA